MDAFEKIKKGIDECESKIDNNTKIKDWVSKERLSLIRSRARRKFGLCINDYTRKILKNLTKDERLDEVLKYRQDEKIMNHIYNFTNGSWFAHEDPEEIKDLVEVGDVHHDDIYSLLSDIYGYLISEEVRHHPKTKWNFEIL